MEDIRLDLEKGEKGGVKQSIENCMTVFYRDPLLKGAIYLKLADDAVANNPDKPVAQKIRNALGQETGYVKVSESDWKKMLRIFRVTRTKDVAVEKMAKDMADKDKKINALTNTIDKCKEFLKRHNLLDAFMEFIKPKEQKREFVHDKIARNKKKIAKEDSLRLDRGRDDRTCGIAI